MLGIDSLHAAAEVLIDDLLVSSVKEYIQTRRMELVDLFNFKKHISDSGEPVEQISSQTKRLILKDKKLYVLNQVLRSQGYATFKVCNDVQIGGGRCPFSIKRYSTKKKFQNFLETYPQFIEFCSSLKTDTVKERRRVLGQCIAKWRTSKKRKMTYKTVLYVSKGDIFQRAFSPASQKDHSKNTNKTTIDVSSITNNYSNTVFPSNSIKKLEVPKFIVVPSKILSNPQDTKLVNKVFLPKSKQIFLPKSKQILFKPIAKPIPIIYKEIVRNKEFEVIECGGGGNCFFHAISRGLQENNIILSYVELRQMLSDWLADFDNAREFEYIFGATPRDIVPFLGHLDHHCPSAIGWTALTENWTWQDWGIYLREDGRWAGGLEITPMNLCFKLYGINSNVNLWKKDIHLLCEETLNSNTILIMLSNNHFQYLKETL